MTELVPPRYGTVRRPDRDTFGRRVAAVSMALDARPMLPWQRYVADVAGEIDPATGLRWYSTVILKVPRQQGKSTLLDAHMVAGSRRPGPDGTARRRKVLYLAQDRQMARERLITELHETKLSRSPFAGRYRARLSNGSERLTWPDTGGYVLALACTPTAGHGLAEVDDVLLDEAFSHRDLTIVNGVAPTTTTATDPQLWIVSTPGDGTDLLLQHYEEVGRLALDDPGTRVAMFDWSATDDDDRDDPAVWHRVIPALGQTLPVARLREYRATLTPGEFDRAYLARRPAVDVVAALDVAAFHGCANPTELELAPTGPLVAAFDVSTDRSWSTLAVAGIADEGRTALLVDRRPGTRWLAEAVHRLQHRPRCTLVEIVADRRAGVGGIIDELQTAGVPVTEVGTSDVVSAAGLLHDLIGTARLVHDNQDELVAAVRGSRRRPIGDAWTFSKLDSVDDVAPLTAGALAVYRLRKLYPVTPDRPVRM